MNLRITGVLLIGMSVACGGGGEGGSTSTLHDYLVNQGALHQMWSFPNGAYGLAAPNPDTRLYMDITYTETEWKTEIRRSDDDAIHCTDISTMEISLQEEWKVQGQWFWASGDCWGGLTAGDPLEKFEVVPAQWAAAGQPSIFAFVTVSDLANVPAFEGFLGDPGASVKTHFPLEGGYGAGAAVCVPQDGTQEDCTFQGQTSLQAEP